MEAVVDRWTYLLTASLTRELGKDRKAVSEALFSAVLHGVHSCPSVWSLNHWLHSSEALSGTVHIA